MKRAIITGPTGAIGVALIQTLIEQNIEVLAVVRKGSKRISNIPQSEYVRVVELDLSELNKLPEVEKNTYDIYK